MSMITVIKRLVPAPIRAPLGRALKKTQEEYWRARFGNKSSLVPPPELMHDGPQSYRDFKLNGDEFLSHYVNLCDLQPHEQILDVGSGIGRKTLPLVDFLDHQGSYDGLELVKAGVDWCTEKYSTRYPNFRFHLIDVYNDLYNPAGKFKATEYRFPFTDDNFDFVVLNSVFTHMISEEVENYLGEIARVLRVGGRCLISFFLLNQESLSLIEEGKSSINLVHKLGPARFMTEDKPEMAIGFDEPYIERLYADLGLEIKKPVFYGSWCGRDKYFSYQDQVVAFKTRSSPKNS